MESCARPTAPRGAVDHAAPESVTETAARLQAAGLIRYRRGSVTIVNRRGLEEAACECYDVVRRGYEQLFRTQGSEERP